MSYILDALRKAESERKLGSIPDMHAQPLGNASAVGRTAWRRPLAWSLLASAVIIAAGIAWLAPWQTNSHIDVVADVGGSLPRQSSSGAVGIDPNREAAPTPLPAVTETPLPPQVQEIVRDEPPARAPLKEARPEPVKPKPAPAPVKKAKNEQIPLTASVGQQASEKKNDVAKPGTALEVEPRLPGFRDLPADIQREIPALSVGGYIYSSVAAERSVLINNRLLREGSEISHGLVLEKMLPKEVVLNYKGYRYRIPY